MQLYGFPPCIHPREVMKQTKASQTVDCDPFGVATCNLGVAKQIQKLIVLIHQKFKFLQLSQKN